MFSYSTKSTPMLWKGNSKSFYFRKNDKNRGVFVSIESNLPMFCESMCKDNLVSFFFSTGQVDTARAAHLNCNHRTSLFCKKNFGTTNNNFFDQVIPSHQKNLSMENICDVFWINITVTRPAGINNSICIH